MTIDKLNKKTGEWRCKCPVDRGLDLGANPPWVAGCGKCGERRPSPSDVIDDDLHGLSKKDLIKEIVKLRKGIRNHRDSEGHNLCWFVPELWNLLPDKIEPEPEVPCTSEFIENCIKYRKSLDK